MLPQLVATNFDAEFEALSYKVFFKWTNPGLFFVYFCPLKQTIQFLQQINVKKCPSWNQRQDSNSQPSDYESPLSTTRPGLPPLLSSHFPIEFAPLQIFKK